MNREYKFLLGYLAMRAMMGLLGLLVIFIIIYLAGCGGHYSTIPNQSAAVEMVWSQAYGQLRYGPPPIQWNSPDCANGYGVVGFLGVVDGASGTVCLLGQYLNPPEDYIQLAPNPGGLFSQGALAHELNHARLIYNMGNAEPNHDGPSWKACGASPAPDCGRVEQANTLLVEAGL